MSSDPGMERPDTLKVERTGPMIEKLARGVEEELCGEDEADVRSRRDRALRELLEIKERLGLA